MSKQIDWTQPMDEATEAYAKQYPGLHGQMLDAHRQQFPREATEDLTGSEGEVPPYAEWSKGDLVAEAKRRNNEEGTSLKTSGPVAELAQQLDEDDAARG